MPFDTMDFTVVTALLMLTLIGIALVYYLAKPKIKHKWVSKPVRKPLVTRTRDFPYDDPFLRRRTPLAIEAPATDTGTYYIPALPRRVQV